MSAESFTSPCTLCRAWPCQCAATEIKPTLLRPRGEGWKDDQRGTKEEKDRWDLLPIGPVREIVKVLTRGAAKYAPNNWIKVPEARDRYYAAALRHLAAWKDGEEFDAEWGLRHLAHAATCVLFLLWFDQQPKEQSK